MIPSLLVSKRQFDNTLRGFNFCVALCGVRNGTLWPSWILYNSGRSESVKCLLSKCNLEHSFLPELITHYTAAATPYLRPYLFPFKEGFSASAAAGSLNNSCIVKHTSGCLHFLGQGCVCALFYHAEGAQCLPVVHTDHLPSHLWLIFTCLCLYSRLRSGTRRWETRKSAVYPWEVYQSDLPPCCLHVFPSSFPAVLLLCHHCLSSIAEIALLAQVQYFLYPLRVKQ